MGAKCEKIKIIEKLLFNRREYDRIMYSYDLLP